MNNLLIISQVSSWYDRKQAFAITVIIIIIIIVILLSFIWIFPLKHTHTHTHTSSMSGIRGWSQEMVILRQVQEIVA
jgi:uncharacterized protein YpmB